MGRGIVIAVIVFSLLIPVVTTSCSETQAPGAEAWIGPEGGVVEVTDPDSPIYGAALNIPEGALETEILVELDIAEESDVPSLPDDLSGIGPVVEVLPPPPLLP